MAKKFITAKKIGINNNCPECYSTDLEMTFKQKVVENAVYKKIYSDYTFEIYCLSCKSSIYPISWNDAFERVINYQKRAFTPIKSMFKLKQLGWVILIGSLILVSGIISCILFIN